MAREKQEICIPSFKVTPAMKQGINEEMEIDHREQTPMIKVLLAEAIENRRAKRNIQRLLGR